MDTSSRIRLLSQYLPWDLAHIVNDYAQLEVRIMNEIFPEDEESPTPDFFKNFVPLITYIRDAEYDTRGWRQFSAVFSYEIKPEGEPDPEICAGKEEGRPYERYCHILNVPLVTTEERVTNNGETALEFSLSNTDQEDILRILHELQTMKRHRDGVIHITIYAFSEERQSSEILERTESLEEKFSQGPWHYEYF